MVIILNNCVICDIFRNLPLYFVFHIKVLADSQVPSSRVFLSLCGASFGGNALSWIHMLSLYSFVVPRTIIIIFH